MLKAAAALLVVGSADASGPRWQTEAVAAARRSAEAQGLVAEALGEVRFRAAAPQPGAPRVPTFPARWWANTTVTEAVNGKVVGSVQTPFSLLACESDLKRYAELKTERFSVAPAEWVGTALEFFNTTVYNADNFIGLAINGATIELSNVTGATNPFAWVQHATSCGQKLHKGRSLACWKLTLPNIVLSLLVDQAGAPVYWEQNSTKSGKTTSRMYEFLKFYPSEGLPWIWDGFNTDDYVHPKACADASHTVSMMMYIFHPKNNFEIAGQDLADLVGDTVFVCSDVITNQTMETDHDYAWLTQWEIEVNPTWGQYENCNGYPPSCMSAEKFRVGHEAAYYLGTTPAFGRQCGANPLVGEWYSLPAAGKCQGDHKPADGSCSWRIVRKVKTIDGQCLFKQGGFRNSCVTEGRAPFPKTSKLFQHAFESSNPADGGCPPINTLEAVVI